MSKEVSIIIPTRNRSQLLGERLKVIVENTKELIDGTAELMIVVDGDDLESKRVVSDSLIHQPHAIVHSKPLELPCNKWNQAAVLAQGYFLVTLSDDCVPEPGWLTNALSLISYGFIGLPDGVTGERNNQFTPLYMATKTWLKKYNGGVLVIPCYKSWYADMETAWRARRARHYMISPYSTVKALHTDFGTAPNDDMYELGKSRREADLKLFKLRGDKGFPDDFKGVL